MISGILRKKLLPLFGASKDTVSRYAQYDEAAKRKPVVLVTLLATDAATRDKAIRTHSKKSSYQAVFVVTNSDVTAFQDGERVFEHIPALHVVREFASSGDWQSYLQERWRTVHLKWGPKWTVCYGRNFEAYLQDCGFSDSKPL